MGAGGESETEGGKKLNSIPNPFYKLGEAASLASTLRLGVATAAAAAAKHDGIEMIGLHFRQSVA